MTAGKRHNMGHSGDVGPPRHPDGVQGRLGEVVTRSQPAQVPAQTEEHGRGAEGRVQEAQL